MARQSANAKAFSAKLTKVFAVLRKAGVTARRNVACCDTCSRYELTEEAKVEGWRYVRYAFTHAQNEDDVREGAYVHVGYGVLGAGEEEDERAGVALGQQIAAAAVACGLAVEWDGTYAHKPKLMMPRDGEEVVHE